MKCTPGTDLGLGTLPYPNPAGMDGCGGAAPADVVLKVEIADAHGSHGVAALGYRRHKRLAHHHPRRRHQDEPHQLRPWIHAWFLFLARATLPSTLRCPRRSGSTRLTPSRSCKQTIHQSEVRHRVLSTSAVQPRERSAVLGEGSPGSTAQKLSYLGP